MIARIEPRRASVSIVVPCYNESDGLYQFHDRLSAALKPLDVSSEIIYVNDGSVDNTIDVIDSLRVSDKRVGVIDLSRNFGKEAALTAGIDHAQGDAVIVIDADLQDPPGLVHTFLEEWRNGYDVVYGRRTDRRRHRNGPSRITLVVK